jgi:hypothetical protein
LYTRAVDIVVSRLRRKLEPLAAIKTLRNAAMRWRCGRAMASRWHHRARHRLRHSLKARLVALFLLLALALTGAFLFGMQKC